MCDTCVMPSNISQNIIVPQSNNCSACVIEFNKTDTKECIFNSYRKSIKTLLSIQVPISSCSCFWKRSDCSGGAGPSGSDLDFKPIINAAAWPTLASPLWTGSLEISSCYGKTMLKDLMVLGFLLQNHSAEFKQWAIIFVKLKLLSCFTLTI